MNLIQIIGALEMGLIYSLVGMGVYISFRTLDFPDLSVDGTFPLGAAISATLITQGTDPFLATLIAIIGGAMAGFLTAWMSTHLKMLNLLAGILTMTALYSINLRIMGRPNVALLGEETLFSGVASYFPDYISMIFIATLAIGTIWWMLSTRLGLAMRSTGINSRMSRAQGINDRKMIWLGLSLSNGMVAFAGALFAQIYGFADVTMGVGTIIIGLAAVIIGEALLPTRTVLLALIACTVGAILYRFVIAVALDLNILGLQAHDLNLVTAVLVAFAMTLPTIKAKMKEMVGHKS